MRAGLNGGVFNSSSEFQTVNNTVDEVGCSRINLGPAIKIRLKDAININIEGGITVIRRLEFIDSSSNEIIDRTPQASRFLSFGISFAPKINNSNANFNF